MYSRLTEVMALTRTHTQEPGLESVLESSESKVKEYKHNSYREMIGEAELVFEFEAPMSMSIPYCALKIRKIF